MNFELMQYLRLHSEPVVAGQEETWLSRSRTAVRIVRLNWQLRKKNDREGDREIEREGEMCSFST